MNKNKHSEYEDSSRFIKMYRESYARWAKYMDSPGKTLLAMGMLMDFNTNKIHISKRPLLARMVGVSEHTISNNIVKLRKNQDIIPGDERDTYIVNPIAGTKGTMSEALQELKCKLLAENLNVNLTTGEVLDEEL